MVVKTTAPKKMAGKQKTTNVKKDISKDQKKKLDGVSKDFELDESVRVTGKVVHFDLKRGFGFVILDDEIAGIPENKVMVHWKEIQSDDRWPFLHRGLKVEMSLAKVKQGSVYTIKGKEISAEGGEPLNLQADAEGKKEYVGDQNMRFLGNVKFYDFEKGFGYVKLQDGYDIDSAVPKEFKIDRNQINSGSDGPRLRNEMEIEFGIAKNKKGQYSCYNVTLPGGADITRDVVEGRENVSSAKYEGVIQFWMWKGSYGWITPDNVKKMPKNIQTAIQEDHEKRSKKAEKKDKNISDSASIFFRAGDKAEIGHRFTKGDKVSFKVYTDSQGVGACQVTAL